MLVRRLRQLELLEDLGDVRFDRALRDEDAGCDGAVRHPFGDEPEHLPFALRQLRERILAAAPPSCDPTGRDMLPA